MSERILENASWISQLVVMFLAICAGFIAFHQLNAFKLYELIKFIEDNDFRDARGIVIREIYPRRHEKWWVGNDEQTLRLRLAAYLVCGKFNTIQIMLERDKVSNILILQDYRRIFIENWSASVLRTHDALVGFIFWHRESWPPYYKAYDRLHLAARSHREKVFEQQASNHDNIRER